MGIEVVQNSEGKMDIIEISEETLSIFLMFEEHEIVRRRNFCFSYSGEPLAKINGEYMDVYGRTWTKVI